MFALGAVFATLSPEMRHEDRYLVQERFHLDKRVRQELKSRSPKFGFGLLSEAVYYRTYSRLTEDGKQETWADTVIRVVEGVMSIRKDWYLNVLGKRWDERYYQAIAEKLAHFMFDMKVLPPGRGLWAMGTDYVYRRGGAALNNCAYVSVIDDLSSTAEWTANMLMCGVGVGFGTHTTSLPSFKSPLPDEEIFRVPDSREGWAASYAALIGSYERGSRTVRFDYSSIRPRGAPISGFGGTAAGPDLLRQGHEMLRTVLDKFVAGEVSETRLVVDAMNIIGHSIISGNVRRSAELAVGGVADDEFLNLKNYQANPDRCSIGYVSNNSVALMSRDDFRALPDIAERIVDNGEPGILNFINIRKYGRLGDRMPDAAMGVNPCGEIPLENYEMCNLVEVFPTRCRDTAEIYEAMELATFYASTVALLRTHSSETNEVIARNRRIGVSVSGIADWLDATSVSHVFDVLNKGYEQVVRPTNARLARDAGVPESVRVTTVKPSGTVSLLAGVSPGMHYPLSGFVIRRMRIASDSPLSDVLRKAGVPFEPDMYSPGTDVFEFPLRYGSGRTRPVGSVSIYEQAALAAMLQRCWADNAVSCTLIAKPSEFNQVERVLALFAPQTKSLSILPDRSEVYPQMPLQEITLSEYVERMRSLSKPAWEDLVGSDGLDSRYCESDSCSIA